MTNTRDVLPSAIFLMGPTASGKTALAVEIVERLGASIISVDSGQIYRQMDIGTAKPDAETRRRAPHRLIDILDPAEVYSAANFRADALREMADVVGAGRVPLLVGGTMLYFRALEHGLSVLPAADPAVRQRLERQAREVGWEALHARLCQVDPAAGARIHPNDPQRIQRALEVFELTGQPLSRLQVRGDTDRLPYQLRKLGIVPASRADLHERIARRFDSMLDQGLVAEVVRLHQRGDLDPAKPAIRTVGYRQLWEYLDGRCSLEQAVERAVTATRQLAKRQLTWMRRDPAIEWFDSQDQRLMDKVLKFLNIDPR